MTKHLSQMTVDGLAARLLSDAETATARAHVASCARCTGDLETAEAACATFTREVLPRTLERLRPRPSPWRIFAPAFAVSALATVLLVVWFVGRSPTPAPDDDVRMKGTVTFQVFASRGDQVFPVRDATRLAAGDKIRFVVGAGEARYVLVASIDGAGQATIYHPYGGARSVPAPVQPTDLPGSIVLDAAPGPERVFALVSREPLDAGEVARALEALGKRGATAIRSTPALDLRDVTQSSVVFEKEAP